MGYGDVKRYVPAVEFIGQAYRPTMRAVDAEQGISGDCYVKHEDYLTKVADWEHVCKKWSDEQRRHEVTKRKLQDKATPREKALQVGSVVKLKSGGPAMTVNRIDGNGTVDVAWFAGEQLCSGFGLSPNTLDEVPFGG
jgi:uncharacterized protein YodC (DUF2158 family)